MIDLEKKWDRLCTLPACGCRFKGQTAGSCSRFVRGNCCIHELVKQARGEPYALGRCQAQPDLRVRPLRLAILASGRLFAVCFFRSGFQLPIQEFKIVRNDLCVVVRCRSDSPSLNLVVPPVAGLRQFQ